MTTDQDFTPGEIQRSLARLEKGMSDVTQMLTATIAPIAVLQSQVTAHEGSIASGKAELTRLEDRIGAMTTRMAWISGVGAGAALLIGHFWK